MTYRAWEQKPLDRTAVRELTAAIAEQAAAQLEEQAMDEAPWSDEKYKAVLAAQQRKTPCWRASLPPVASPTPPKRLPCWQGRRNFPTPPC